MTKKTFYITTPIYYVNDVPHIGHAYTTTVCDVLARFMRLEGYEVKFVTGTDEHGQKVEQSARKAGVSPQDFVDRVSQNFRDLLERLHISNDDFIRTTQPRHQKAAQHLWSILEERGHIYLDSYAGWYSMRDECFYNEAEIIEGKAPTGSPVEWVAEESYFFRLSAWQDKLLDHYKKHKDFVAPTSRLNEVVSFVERGLRDLCISRSTFRWGIPVPLHQEKHIMYVWLDALTNYITAVGYPDTASSSFQKFWPATLHVVGKDILRFHAVYWPAFLMAAGLPLPEKIYAHGFWTHAGVKMSKSLGNGVDPIALIDKYSIDAVRYFFIRDITLGHDGDYSDASLRVRNNSDLSNALGNLVQRVLSMIGKNCDQKIPGAYAFLGDDEDLLMQAETLIENIRPLIRETQELQKACQTIWHLVDAANRYIDVQAPWVLRKTDRLRMETVLYVLAEVIRYLGIILQPFMPHSAQKILDQLNIPKDKRAFSNLTAADRLVSGSDIEKPQGIFPRFIEEAEVK